MRKLRFGDYCWFRGEGWVYEGVTEEGIIGLVRPTQSDPFELIECMAVLIADEEDYDNFCQENGETVAEKRNRKGEI